MIDIDFNNINELIRVLNFQGKEQEELWLTARNIRNNTIGNKVYLRGLIEFSNICRCQCNYCGLRAPNKTIERYSIKPEDIVL